MSEDIRH